MRFSVIIPVRDDDEGLGVAMEGLHQQTRPPDEVIIVNASERSLVAPRDSTLPIRVVDCGPSFPGKARNAGARAAHHPWLVFLDAGVRPTPEWLDAFHRAAVQVPDAEVIQGCYVPNLCDEWDLAAAGVYLPPRPTPYAGNYPTTASLCVRRTFWDSTGGMAEELRAGEDLLFFRLIEDRPVRTVPAPAARVLWNLPKGPREHYRRLRRYSSATWPTELARSWQWPLLRMYAVVGAIMSAIPWLHPALLPVVPALVLARIARNYHRRRNGLQHGLTPTRAVRLVAMTGLVDAATLSGVLDALSSRRPS